MFSFALLHPQYNQEIHYVEPCLNGTLVRADTTNKDHFREHLDKLFAKGIGLLGEALTEAFTILNDFNQTGRGSVCSQAIMLVTDGATEMYDDVFEKYNWPDRKVRIFPYLIGRESAFADNLKWMACANKGYFSQISTLADVQENVMRYLHVMSRPKVIDHEHDTVWTEAYADSALRGKSGPALTTTVAMPVFSTKNETKNQGILLGVAGTDIPLQELMKLIPKHMLGIHGYAFAITNNGYILTHPDLRPLYQEGQRRRKPYYSSVDLSEVEWEDKDDILRNAMVNRRTGTFSMDVKRTVDRGVRLQIRLLGVNQKTVAIFNLVGMNKQFVFVFRGVFSRCTTTITTPTSKELHSVSALLFQEVTESISSEEMYRWMQGSVIWNSQMSPWQMNGPTATRRRSTSTAT
uniref:Calcium channel, voltage dependent, alpha2/delta subunit 3 n=1 Tax=Poecilia reticulata TaxID=8081 RepID=A0A3P9NG23_POERE